LQTIEKDEFVHDVDVVVTNDEGFLCIGNVSKII